jgi:uncharacterized phage protein gp47/JayE
MIDFSQYTQKNIEAAMLEQVDDSLDKREGSLVQTSTAPVAWWLEGMYLTLDKIQKNSSPYDAVGEALDNIASLRGVTRKAATPAVRQGVFNASIPAGSRFKTINGADSVVFDSGDLISESNGTYIYKLTCETAGIIGNSYTGSLIPITAISGLSSAAIGSIITEGAEEESDAALRARFFASFDALPYGGNISEYRQTILGIPGVGAVQIYPANNYNGGGTVLCSILNSQFMPATQALVNTVQEAICPIPVGSNIPSNEGFGVAPIGASVTITTGTEMTLNISADITFVDGVIDGLETYGDEIKEQIENYIASVRASWGKPIVGHSISYPVVVYAARLVYAILNVPEVANVSNLKINNQSGDLTLTENKTVQYVPVVGEVTLNEV